MSVLANTFAVATMGIDVFLIVAGLRLERRIRRLEAYEAKRRERLHRLPDSDAAREFQEWRKRWNAS